MELLAILSTIILLGTVATLILAVASYILYKARERRNARIEGSCGPTRPPQLVTVPPPQGFGQDYGAYAPPFDAPASPAPAATYLAPTQRYAPPTPHLHVWDFEGDGYALPGTDWARAPERRPDHDENLAWLG